VREVRIALLAPRRTPTPCRPHHDGYKPHAPATRRPEHAHWAQGSSAADRHSRCRVVLVDGCAHTKTMSGWRRCDPGDGSAAYFFNIESGETLWALPDGIDPQTVPEFGFEDEQHLPEDQLGEQDGSPAHDALEPETSGALFETEALDQSSIASDEIEPPPEPTDTEDDQPLPPPVDIDGSEDDQPLSVDVDGGDSARIVALDGFGLVESNPLHAFGGGLGEWGLCAGTRGSVVGGLSHPLRGGRVMSLGYWEPRHGESRGLESGEEYWVHRLSGETRWGRPSLEEVRSSLSDAKVSLPGCPDVRGDDPLWSVHREVSSTDGWIVDVDANLQQLWGWSRLGPSNDSDIEWLLTKIGLHPSSLQESWALAESAFREQTGEAAHWFTLPTIPHGWDRPDQFVGTPCLEHLTHGHEAHDAVLEALIGSAGADSVTSLYRRLAALSALIQGQGSEAEWRALLVMEDRILPRFVVSCFAPLLPPAVCKCAAQAFFLMTQLDDEASRVIITGSPKPPTHWRQWNGIPDALACSTVTMLAACHGWRLRWPRSRVAVERRSSAASAAASPVDGGWAVDGLPVDEECLFSASLLFETVLGASVNAPLLPRDEEPDHPLDCLRNEPFRDSLCALLVFATSVAPRGATTASLVSALSAFVVALGEVLPGATDIPGMTTLFDSAPPLIHAIASASLNVLSRVVEHERSASVSTTGDQVNAAIALVRRLLLPGALPPSQPHLFFSTDLRVLVDIVLRELVDLPEDEPLRADFLHLLTDLLLLTQWLSDGSYRRGDIVVVVSELVTSGAFDKLEAVRQAAQLLLVECRDLLEE
jgi:hypothetical protein